MLKTIIVSVLLGLPLPAVAALVCTPQLVWHKAPWEGNAINVAGSIADQADAFTALDAVVVQVQASRQLSATDALTYTKCLAAAVAAEARGNAALTANLRAWIAARGGV